MHLLGYFYMTSGVNLGRLLRAPKQKWTQWFRELLMCTPRLSSFGQPERSTEQGIQNASQLLSPAPKQSALLNL